MLNKYRLHVKQLGSGIEFFVNGDLDLLMSFYDDKNFSLLGFSEILDSSNT